MNKDDLEFVREALLEIGQWNWLSDDADETIPDEVCLQYNKAVDILDRELMEVIE